MVHELCPQYGQRSKSSVLHVMLADKFSLCGDTDEQFMRQTRAGAKFTDKEWDAGLVDAKMVAQCLLDHCQATSQTA